MNRPLAALLGSMALTACCIARGTLVSTPRGKRPIEELIEQDTVWSIDPTTGERAASHVIAVARATREVMRLSGDGFSLTCTTDHPLYDPFEKVWAPAGDWALGKRSALLAVPDDGAPPRVVMVRERQVSAGVSEVIDLSVQHELHNFVAAGVLVHNKKPPPPFRTCEVPSDAGGVTLQQGAPCSLPDGGTGFVDCTSSSGTTGGTCEE